MKKLLISIFAILYLAILYNISIAGSDKTLIINLEGSKLKFPKTIPEFDESVSDVLQVYPERILTLQIGNKEIIIIMIDSKISDTRGVIYLLRDSGKYALMDYVYDVSGDSIDDFLLLDIDGDNTEEIITVWSDESTYRIQIDKIEDRNSKTYIRNVFNSIRLLSPLSSDIGTVFCLNNNSLYFLYRYYGGTVLKRGILTINPNDTTREIYLKPVGIITIKEWKKCMKSETSLNK